MTDDVIRDIVAQLGAGRYRSEQAVSQGIVLRVLAELGWPQWDPGAVWPEYRTGEGRVDFALCHPDFKPAVFIEVKQPGLADSGVRQALEYAFHSGVPFVVLTDGQTWSFYLPAEQGSYDDRRVYRLNVVQTPAEECAEVLARYLTRTGWQSGEVIELARKEYRSRTRRQQARSALAAAWQALLRDHRDLLDEMLSDKVCELTGVRPDADDLGEFLCSLSPTGDVVPPPPPARATPPSGPVTTSADVPVHPPRRRSSPSRATSFGATVLGQRYEARSAIEELVVVLRVLADRDPTFLERCSQHKGNRGHRCQYIARSPSELSPGRDDLNARHESIRDPWIVYTCISNTTKTRILRMACDVAGVGFGIDVKVSFAHT